MMKYLEPKIRLTRRDKMKCCCECSDRYVGCHSQCQKYIVNKVIKMYHNQKRIDEYEIDYNIRMRNAYSKKLRKELSGY